MVGVVLISHGDLAKGIVSSASMLVPKIEQLASVTLWPDDNPDEFQQKLEAAVKEMDTGDGVFILADMLGGTPANRAMYSLGDRVRVLTGLSLPMLYSFLNVREETNDIASIAKDVMDEAREALIDVNEMVKNSESGGEA
ncbi:MAG: PTS sugar transporter subunit IIA [Treponema sp.]|jgi:mannose/fructose-specific phosphotransferase system component IIA|nr:PTS sugar transporter subunit IIA [Treponema sp.]